MLGKAVTVSDVRAAQKGDREAFARLVEPIEARLYQLALGITGNRQDAEDAWQNALLRAWKSIDRVKEPEAFRAWIAKIVVNECRRTLRSRVSKGWFRQVSTSNGEPEDIHNLHGIAVDATLETAQDMTQDIVHQMVVLSYLQSLPEEQREALVLRFWLDMPLQEVAQSTGVPLGTVKSRLYRGLEALRPLLAQEGFGHDGNR